MYNNRTLYVCMYVHRYVGMHVCTHMCVLAHVHVCMWKSICLFTLSLPLPLVRFPDAVTVHKAIFVLVVLNTR